VIISVCHVVLQSDKTEKAVRIYLFMVFMACDGIEVVFRVMG